MCIRDRSYLGKGILYKEYEGKTRAEIKKLKEKRKLEARIT